MTEVAVVSPHFDDAALSVGALIHRLARRGDRVRIITVLACDPSSSTVEPPGWWDAMCGFDSAASAARTRRHEDRKAAGILGATPVWLPFGDVTYGRGATDDVVWAAVAAEIETADIVLVPGYPLVHPDHLWVARLVLGHRRDIAARIAFYCEQPYLVGTLMRRERDAVDQTSNDYAGGIGLPELGQYLRCVLAREQPPESALRDSGVLEATVRWGSVRTSLSDRHAKRKAIASYWSQIRAIGLAPIAGALLYEAVKRGETVAWAGER